MSWRAWFHRVIVWLEGGPAEGPPPDGPGETDPEGGPASPDPE